MRAGAMGVFVFVLALAVASPALAGPDNSTIGAKKLEEDMVHSLGVGYPSLFYEWWKKGPGLLDWGLSGELVYGDWAAFTTGERGFNFRVRSRLIRIGFAASGMLRFHLMTKKRPKVTNDTAIIFKPGILLSGNTLDTFTFAVKTEIGVPFSVDINERITFVTGGYIPLTTYINNDIPNGVTLPLLVRLGIEIEAAEKVAPWFYFDLGPAVNFITGPNSFTDTDFAFRIGAGTAFWSLIGK